MSEQSYSGKKDSGCADCGNGKGSGAKRQPLEPQGPGKRFVRPLRTPATSPQIHLHKAVEPLSEVMLLRPGSIPVRVVVPSREATPELS